MAEQRTEEIAKPSESVKSTSPGYVKPDAPEESARAAMRASKMYDEAVAAAEKVLKHNLDETATKSGLFQAIEAGRRAYDVRNAAYGALGSLDEYNRLLDPTGRPIEGTWYGGISHREDEINLTISRREFEEMNDKTRAVLVEVALAQQRIAKDQLEIDLLKTETREALKRLRAT